jgi:hypothetical protein
MSENKEERLVAADIQQLARQRDQLRRNTPDFIDEFYGEIP